MKFSVNQSAFLSKIFACELTIKAEVYAIFCFSANASSSTTTSWCCCCCKNFPTFHVKANKINQKQMTANGCEHTERERARESTSTLYWKISFSRFSLQLFMAMLCFCFGVFLLCKFSLFVVAVFLLFFLLSLSWWPNKLMKKKPTSKKLAHNKRAKKI